MDGCRGIGLVVMVLFCLAIGTGARSTQTHRGNGVDMNDPDLECGEGHKQEINDVAYDEINWEDDSEDQITDGKKLQSSSSTKMAHKEYARNALAYPWRNEILKGVDVVEILGAPGRMLVHGENAQVILANKDSEAFIAAATLKKGRVIVFTHASYLKLFTKPPTSNTKMVANMKKWVSSDSYQSDQEICDALTLGSNLDDIPGTCKILVWQGAYDESDRFYQNLIAWVSNGGGLVCGFPVWVYLSRNPDKTPLEMPLVNILEEIGITFRSYHISGGEVKASRYQKKKAEGVHIRNMLEECKADVGALPIRTETLESVLDDVSDRSLNDILPEYYTMIDHHCIHSEPAIHCIPKPTHFVKTPSGRGLAALMNKIMLKTGQYNGRSVAPGIAEFPGDFDEPPILVDREISASVNGSLYRSFPTGFYLPAGQELEVSWSNPPSKTWQIIIGGHDDHLYRTTTYERWPQVQMIRDLKESPLKIKSPFGGLIYLNSPQKAESKITVSLKNVVEAPMFDLRTSGADWESDVRNRPGLWADISGEKITLTMPSSSIRKLPDPTATMRLWDEVVSAHYELAGQDPSRGRGQWFVTDQQPVAGSMHAGYPIVTHLDVADPNDKYFLFNGELLKEDGMWGPFHEIGHNMQQKVWTWPGTSEVTVNIFSLHAMDKIPGIKPWDHRWIRTKFPKYQTFFDDGAKYEDWKSSPQVALGIYAQLARDFGWDAYKAVFRSYIGLPNKEIPETEEDKIDEWIIRFSKQVDRNLSPQFMFWGFEIRPRVQEELKELIPCMPDDETTQEMAPKWADEIKQKYPLIESCGQ